MEGRKSDFTNAKLRHAVGAAKSAQSLAPLEAFQGELEEGTGAALPPVPEVIAPVKAEASGEPEKASLEVAPVEAMVAKAEPTSEAEVEPLDPRLRLLPSAKSPSSRRRLSRRRGSSG